MSESDCDMTGSVFILSGVKGDTRRYRAFHLCQQLQYAGVDSVATHLWQLRSLDALLDASVVVLQRVAYDPWVEKILARCRAQKIPVLYDTDDLTFLPEVLSWIDSDDFDDPLRVALYRDEMQRQQQVLRSCDGVLVSTEFLAEKVRALGKPTWVHRNAASFQMVRLSEQARQERRLQEGRLILGYASGTPTHQKDFALAAPALIEFLRRNHRAGLWVIGYLNLGPEWLEFAERVRKFDPVPWRQLPFWLAQLDVNLAPLRFDNPFSQSKSEIKYMEAALVGVPTIASPTAAFQYAIRSSENGYLATSKEDWLTALDCLSVEQNRYRVAQMALQDVANRYEPQVRAKEAIGVFNQVCDLGKAGFVRQNSSVRWDWAEALEAHPSLFERAMYVLRWGGIKILFLQMRVYVWRLLKRWWRGKR